MNKSTIRTRILAGTIAFALPVLLPGGVVAAASGDNPQTTQVVPAAARKTVRVPRWIDATGRKDVTRALQRFIDSVPDGRTIKFRPRTSYRLGSGGLRLNGRSDLVLAGNGAQLRSAGCAPDDSVVVIGQGAPSTDIVIRGFQIAGNNARGGTGDAFRAGCQHAHGIAVYRSRRVSIANVTIRRTNGDCVYIGGGGYTRSYDVTFRDSTCKLSGRQGVAITAGERIRIVRVRFYGIGLIAFDIEPNTAADGAVDVTFKRNKVGRTGRSKRYSPMFFGANGNLDATVRNINISNNIALREPLRTLVGDEDKGWSGGRNHHDIRFVNNKSRVRSRGPVLQFKHVDGLIIRNNAQPLSSGRLAQISDSVRVTYVP